MKTLDLIQGSAEWHAHRATHFNASDAPAMMNCSPYETRQQLIHRLWTGIGREVDVATQKRFDDGHRFENLARPLAEEIVGEDLYPVTGSEGELSASFDGLTMAEDVGFEHKTLNDTLREALPAKGLNEGVTLPLLYRVQMEQQCMVAGCERELFMASKWERLPEFPEDDPRGWKLEEERHCWYESSQHLADDIAAGWRQLAVDLAAYVPEEPAAPKPTGRAREALPALVFQAKGELTGSNLAAYKVKALEVLEGILIPSSKDGDQQFADAKEDGRYCRGIESAMKQAEDLVLGGMASIDEALKTIRFIGESYRRRAIDLENAVEVEEKRRKQKILTDGVDALRDHVAALNARIGGPYMPAISADFAGAAKNKRTPESLKNAVDSTLAAGKIEADRIAAQIEANLKVLASNAEFKALFPDEPTLVLKAVDDLNAVVVARIASHKADEEAKREAAAEKPAAPAPAPAVVKLPTRAATAPATKPTLSLGQIKDRIAPLQITADGMAQLGFKGVKDRGAVLFHEADYPHILASFVTHIQALQAKQAA